MKLFPSLFTALLVAATLSSCGGGSARKLNGSWTGEPSAIDSEEISIDCIPVYTFDSTGDNCGNVSLTSMLSIETPLWPTDSLMSSGWITAAGLASMQGTYRLADNGIYLRFDTTTFQLIVDDEATRLTFDTVNPEEMPGYVTMRDSCAQMLRTSLPSLILSTISRDSVMTDITFTKDLFTATLPASGRSETFRRQVQK